MKIALSYGKAVFFGINFGKRYENIITVIKKMPDDKKVLTALAFYYLQYANNDNESLSSPR